MSIPGSYFDGEFEQEIDNTIEHKSVNQNIRENINKFKDYLSEITEKYSIELVDLYYSNECPPPLPNRCQLPPNINIYIQPFARAPIIPPIQQQISPYIIPITYNTQITPITPILPISPNSSNYPFYNQIFPPPINKESKKIQANTKTNTKGKTKTKTATKIQSRNKSTKADKKKGTQRKKEKQHQHRHHHHHHHKSTASKQRDTKSNIINIESGGDGGIIQYFDQKAAQTSDQNSIQIFINEIGSSFEDNFESLNECFKKSSEFIHYERFRRDDWIIVDFKDNQVEITGYSIKSSTYDEDCTHIKNWSVDISEDGLNWETIDEHSNYGELNGPSITKTFKVRPTHFSRYARLMSKGDFYGSNDGWELEIGYVEFYGRIKMPTKK